MASKKKTAKNESSPPRFRRYEVIILKPAQKQISALSSSAAGFIDNALRSLEENPFPTDYKELKGNLRGIYRIRAGNYRILYQVERDRVVVIVLSVSDRKETYKKK